MHIVKNRDITVQGLCPCPCPSPKGQGCEVVEVVVGGGPGEGLALKTRNTQAATMLLSEVMVEAGCHMRRWEIFWALVKTWSTN